MKDFIELKISESGEVLLARLSQIDMIRFIPAENKTVILFTNGYRSVEVTGDLDSIRRSIEAAQ